MTIVDIIARWNAGDRRGSIESLIAYVKTNPHTWVQDLCRLAPPRDLMKCIKVGERVRIVVPDGDA